MTPTLIVTRPKAQAERFAQAVAQSCGDNVRIITSPLLRIDPLPAQMPTVSGVIFTSTNGVAQSRRLGVPSDVPAWCVGERTADAAQALGHKVSIGPGDAADLTDMIVAERPTGPLAHVRGQHARGNVAARLTTASIPCADIIAYTQTEVALTPAALAALAGPDPVVLPIFSPRTGQLLQTHAPFAAPVHLIAISEAALPTLPAQSVKIADKPDGNAVLDATLACLAALNGQRT